MLGCTIQEDSRIRRTKNELLIDYRIKRRYVTLNGKNE